MSTNLVFIIDNAIVDFSKAFQYTMLLFTLCILFGLVSTYGESAKKSSFALHELSSCTTAQESLKNFLCTHAIPVNGLAGSLRAAEGAKEDAITSRIVVSSEGNNIECRIALGKAPIGSKCIAPCGCTGSQKWIQFSEFNMLRRRDPQQWIRCPTCQQQFQYDIFTSYGGLSGNILGLALNYPLLLRAVMTALGGTLAIGINIPSMLLAGITSKTLWQLVSHTNLQLTEIQLFAHHSLIFIADFALLIVSNMVEGDSLAADT